MLNATEKIIRDGPNPTNWQSFTRLGKVESLDFKKNSAAETTFIVDENVLKIDKIVKRKIKKVLVFTKDDIINITFASSSLDSFDQEEKEFNKFIEDLDFK